ncbi:Transcription factor [Thalictrum thalictroides]|uniref:Transcription factor n=1 Tax=Thalictrum thalictroides TaxID=46969 RepID=A0A7J6X0W7_THATH|nr:Transcription factor [Thalictrum thalictroides]
METSSSLISNPESNSTNRLIESKRKKRKKNLPQIQNKKETTRWRTQDEQQNYSSKLIEALRQVRRNSSTTNEITTTTTVPPPTGRVIREAADRALAVAAKGRTRWSRAILTNRLKLKFKKKKPRMITGKCRSKKQQEETILKLKGKKQPALQRKVRVLGRLVPGCQKLSFPVILEEATDYIAALEMQVRTMTALTELLSVAASTTIASPPQSPGELNLNRFP